MTGTGVQNGPYIPTTLTEFITAVGTAGAYVALTQDISAANDPNYGGITIVIKAGQTVNNAIFRPMLCTAEDWSASKEYVPYTPTLSELYQMVKALQSGV